MQQQQQHHHQQQPPHTHQADAEAILALLVKGGTFERLRSEAGIALPARLPMLP